MTKKHQCPPCTACDATAKTYAEQLNEIYTSVANIRNDYIKKSQSLDTFLANYIESRKRSKEEILMKVEGIQKNYRTMSVIMFASGLLIGLDIALIIKIFV